MTSMTEKTERERALSLRDEGEGDVDDRQKRERKGALTLRDEREGDVAGAPVVGDADEVVAEVRQLHVVDGQRGRRAVDGEKPATRSASDEAAGFAPLPPPHPQLENPFEGNLFFRFFFVFEGCQ